MRRLMSNRKRMRKARCKRSERTRPARAQPFPPPPRKPNFFERLFGARPPAAASTAAARSPARIDRLQLVDLTSDEHREYIRRFRF